MIARILEFFYYLSGIAAFITGFIIMLIGVFTYFSSQEIRKKEERYKMKVKAIKASNEFNKLIHTYEEMKETLNDLNPSDLQVRYFTEKSLMDQMGKDYHNISELARSRYSNNQFYTKILNFLNKLDVWSMQVTENIVDEDIIYNANSAVFFEFIKAYYIDLCIVSRWQPYKYIIKLYNMWETKKYSTMPTLENLVESFK